MKLFVGILLVFLLISSPEKEEQNEQFHQISKKFSRANSKHSSFKKIRLNGYDFYEANGVLQKVIIKEDKNIYEYYFDTHCVEKGAYFVFSQRYEKGKKIQNRYYFGNDNALIRWLDPNLEEVKDSENLKCKEMALNAISKDLLIRLNNYKLNQKRPHYSDLIQEIDQKVTQLEQLKLITDTVHYKKTGNDFTCLLEYKTAAGDLIKKEEIKGDNFTGKRQISYYDTTGELLHTYDSFGYLFVKKTHTGTRHYYHKEKLFRSITHNSYTDVFGNSCWGFSYVYNDQLTDY